MASYNPPNFTKNPSLMAWLKQNQATSGKKPSNSVIEAMMEAENNTMANKALAEDQAAERKREFDLSFEANEDARKSSTVSGLGSSAAQIAMMYAMMGNKTPKIDPTTGKEIPGMFSKGVDAVKGLFNPKTQTTELSTMLGKTGTPTIAPASTIMPGTGGTVAGGSTLSAIPVTAPIANASGEMATGAMELAPTASGVGTEGAVTAGTAAGSTSLASIPVIGAAIAGAMATKEGMRKYATGGEDEKGGPIGYLANVSQHPVAGVMNPASPLIDTGIIKRDSGVGRAIDILGGNLAERTIMDKIGCAIIMTSIHGSNSYEVNICREYKELLTKEQLRGYYVFAEPVCFIMEKHPKTKDYFRRYLTKSFIDYAEHKLDKRKRKPALKSIIISKLFLRMCAYLGKIVPQYTRINGEVF